MQKIYSRLVVLVYLYLPECPMACYRNDDMPFRINDKQEVKK